MMLFSRAFHPDERIGTQRPFSFFKYLPRLGTAVWVVAGSPNKTLPPGAAERKTYKEFFPETDAEEFPAAAESGVSYVSVAGPPHWTTRLRDAVTGFQAHAPAPLSAPATPLRKAASVFSFRRFGAHYAWARAALREAERLCTPQRPDWIGGTFGGEYENLCTAETAAVLAKTALLADFRDGWDWFFRGRGQRRLLRRMLAPLLQRADLITGVGRGVCRELTEEFGVAAQVVYNGFDAEEFAAVRAAVAAETEAGNNKFTVLYSGTVWENEAWDIFAEGFARFLRDEPRKDQVGLAYTGGTKELFDAVMRGHGLSKNVHAGEAVSRAEALAQQLKSDLLLLIPWGGAADVLPGKFFDYLGGGKPIMAVCNAGGELAELVRRTESGAVCSDAKSVARYLQKCFLNRRPREQRQPAKATEEFTRERQARRLLELLDEAAGTQAAGAAKPSGDEEKP